MIEENQKDTPRRLARVKNAEGREFLLFAAVGVVEVTPTMNVEGSMIDTVQMTIPATGPDGQPGIITVRAPVIFFGADSPEAALAELQKQTRDGVIRAMAPLPKPEEPSAQEEATPEDPPTPEDGSSPEADPEETEPLGDRQEDADEAAPCSSCQ